MGVIKKTVAVGGAAYAGATVGRAIGMAKMKPKVRARIQKVYGKQLISSYKKGYDTGLNKKLMPVLKGVYKRGNKLDKISGLGKSGKVGGLVGVGLLAVHALIKRGRKGNNTK